MSCASLIATLRKQGQLEEAYKRGRECLEQNREDSYLQRTFGWVLYDLIKRELATVGDGDEQEDGKEQEIVSAKVNISDLDDWFWEYEQLHLLPRPDLLHSLMLGLACKAHKAGWWCFVQFIRQCGFPENLREEDCQERRTSDDTPPLMSLELRVYLRLANALLKDNLQEEDKEWVFGLLQSEGLSRYPDDPWLHRAVGIALWQKGGNHEALQHLRHTLRKKQKDWWIWAEVARVYREIDPQIALHCYYHAYQLQRDKSFLVSVYEEIASLLAEQQEYEAAAWFVHEAVRIRTEKSWRIPDSLEQLRRARWCVQYPAPRCPKIAPSRATLFCVLHGISPNQLTETRGFVDHHNPKQEGAYIRTGSEEDAGIFVRYEKCPSLRKQPEGTVVALTLYETDGRKTVVECLPLPDQQEIEGFLEWCEGAFRKRAEQAFGFVHVGDRTVFVPPHLASHHNDGEQLKVLACRKWNPKRNEMGWSAVRVEPAE
ncbi:Protein of unknown function (DUF2989) [Armatimonadetes bacterium DC]|nr:Protein of unknown function (DUF2989) [Armatimonadetes bacterium DC]